MKVEYGRKEGFEKAVRQFASNTGVSHSDTLKRLTIFAYKWAIWQYQIDKAHKIHRNLIAHSFCWAAFAHGVADCSKKDGTDSAPRDGKSSRQPYNRKKLDSHMRSGNTAMSKMGDPLVHIHELYKHLTDIYRQIKQQVIAVGMASHTRTQQIEMEILKHFDEMEQSKKYDTIQLPSSVP